MHGPHSKMLVYSAYVPIAIVSTDLSNAESTCSGRMGVLDGSLEIAFREIVADSTLISSA